MTSPLARCRRPGCGRPLRSPASVARGMSKACAIREALRIAVAPYSDRQRNVSCSGCGPQMPLEQCPDRLAITKALLGEDGQ